MARRGKPTASSASESDPKAAEHYDLLVNSVTEFAIYTLDLDGYITDWNTGAERIKGYRAEEIIGQHFSIFYSEEDRGAGVPARALETARRKGIYEAQSWRVRKGGARFMAHVVLQPLYDAAGRPVGFAKLTRDVSEPFKQQRALEETRAALARAQRSAAMAPLGGIAHDLNNLLQVIRNTAQLLRSHLPADDPQAQNLAEMLRRNTDGAASLVLQLLKLARGQSAEPAALNVNDLIAGMTELLRELLGDSVTIETVLAGGVGSVATDPEELKAAILNLVVNARNALPERGRVTLETANVSAAQIGPAGPIVEAKPPEGEFVMIAVLDTGTGMTSEIVAKAFSHSGPGPASPEVGMSQVHSFAQQVGGHLRIETAPGRGTAVRVYLPRLAERSAGEPADGAPKPKGAEGSASAPAPEGNLAGLRVLVVEDEALIAMHVEGLLEDVGCASVVVAPSIDEALAAVARGEFDLALLDVNVGKDLVYPVADALKARHIPFVFMSGLAAMEERWAEQPRLRKPFELEQLCEAMCRAVREARP